MSYECLLSVWERQHKAVGYNFVGKSKANRVESCPFPAVRRGLFTLISAGLQQSDNSLIRTKGGAESKEGAIFDGNRLADDHDEATITRSLVEFFNPRILSSIISVGAQNLSVKPREDDRKKQIVMLD